MMKTELEKKKKIFGLTTGGIFMLWMIIEMWMIWIDWEPMWDRIEWMVDEGLMSRRYVLDCFLTQIGRTNILFYVVMGLSTLIFFALGVGGAKKERMNVFVVTAIFTIFATDAIRVIMALKKLIVDPVAVGASLSAWKILYVLGGGCATAIWFFVFVMAVVSATGNSIFKKTWFVPGMLYILWAALYFFGVPMMVASKNGVAMSDSVALSDINHFVLGGGIILLGYWLSLFMPERKKKKVEADVMENAWDETQIMDVREINNLIYANEEEQNVQPTRQNSMRSKQNKMR